MTINNIHERALPVRGAAAGSLIDGLAGADDRLWPHDRWPPMRFAGGLREGNEGGHGPVRYQVLQHQPGCLVRFRFTGPPGLLGEHRFELQSGEGTSGEGTASQSGEGTVILRHVLSGRAEGRMRWQWPLLFGPLHDALIEDSLDRAVAAMSETTYQPARWPVRVRTLRWLLKGLI